MPCGIVVESSPIKRKGQRLNFQPQLTFIHIINLKAYKQYISYLVIVIYAFLRLERNYHV